MTTGSPQPDARSKHAAHPTGLELFAAEYEPLRQEVNQTVDRMNGNEQLASASVFAIILFQLNFEVTTRIPDWIVVPATSAIGLLIVVLCRKRSFIYRRHQMWVEDYLFSIERELAPNGGWTNHYRKKIKPKFPDRMGPTRDMFWHFLMALAFVNLVLQLLTLNLHEGGA